MWVCWLYCAPVDGFNGACLAAGAGVGLCGCVCCIVPLATALTVRVWQQVRPRGYLGVLVVLRPMATALTVVVCVIRRL